MGKPPAFENSLGMRMVPIQAGRFYMGSPASERGRQEDERLHEVRFDHGFHMSSTEVTQSQFEEIMGWNRSFFRGPHHPVEGVSWKEAETFCQRLSEREGKTYRLPTEAQWEYACKAGGDGPFSGPGSLDELGWYSDQSEGRTREVAQKQPNAWGLFDMCGNVAEWCLDDYMEQYPQADRCDPWVENQGVHKVVRGGSWDYSILGCRCAARSRRPSSHPHKTVGFRVVLLP